jgi:hypothetical protein
LAKHWRVIATAMRESEHAAGLLEAPRRPIGAQIDVATDNRSRQEGMYQAALAPTLLRNMDRGRRWSTAMVSKNSASWI